MKQVSKDEFYKIIVKQDVCVSIENSKFPYTSLFKTRSGYIKGKIIDYFNTSEGERIKSNYFLAEN